MTVTGLRRNRLTLVVMAATAFAVVATPSTASAQERQRPRTLIELLFGGPSPRERESQRPASKQPAASPRKRAAQPTSRSVTSIATRPPALAAAATAEQAAPVEKLANARTILVIGDFFAGGIADGLEDAFAAAPGVVIRNDSNGSSGLVRTDYYDWLQELPRLIDEAKPAMVVVELGANDRQDMSLETGTEAFGSDGFKRDYERRIARLAAIVTQRKIPLIWVGIPPFKSPRMSTDAIALNGVLRAQVEKAGGEFIDVWDGFVDENGRFVITGSDVKGQQVRLRGADGINLTEAGKRKIAFYVEKAARRHLGEMPSPQQDTPVADPNSLPALANLPDAALWAITHTPPILLSDPELDGGAKLLGDGPAIPINAADPTPRDLLLQNGEGTSAPAGRIDDFALRDTPDEPPTRPAR